MDRERVLNKKRERKGEKQKGSEERKNNSLHRIKGKFIVMLPSDVSIRDAFFFNLIQKVLINITITALCKKKKKVSVFWKETFI